MPQTSLYALGAYFALGCPDARTLGYSMLFNSLALPFVANFAAGAIAGISEILTFYPLGESHRSEAHTSTPDGRTQMS